MTTYPNQIISGYSSTYKPKWLNLLVESRVCFRTTPELLPLLKSLGFKVTKKEVYINLKGIFGWNLLFDIYMNNRKGTFT